MPPKRNLGLGKAAAAKKKRTESPAPEPQKPADNELTVELGEEVGANDALAQLRALWRNFILSTERNELMVNGIIHECDRMLRKVHNAASKQAAEEAKTVNGNEAKENGSEGAMTQNESESEEQKSAEAKAKDSDEEEIALTDEFYAIYGLALSSLGFFHTEAPLKVAEFFAEANDRIQVGKQKYAESLLLLFAEARILINEIPLLAIRPLTIESKVSRENRDVGKLLDECLAVWQRAELQAISSGELAHFNLENSDFLQALDDLLDMVDNFGKEAAEGRDSDSEDDADEEDLVLGANHPLKAIGETDKYNLWWREHTQTFLDSLKRKMENSPRDENDVTLCRELSKRLGQSLMMEAEEPTNTFTTLTYYSKDTERMNGLLREEARAVSQGLLKRALEYLKEAQDEEEPDSWAAVAEAMISLGNTYDLDSSEQESIYQEAEALLTRANNATNGRYDKILENLTAEADI